MLLGIALGFVISDVVHHCIVLPLEPGSETCSRGAVDPNWSARCGSRNGRVSSDPAPALRASLEKRGIRVSVEAKQPVRRIERMQPASRPDLDFTRGELRLIESLGSNDCGQIVIPGRSTIKSVLLVCRVFSGARIFVVARSAKHARKLSDLLGSALPGRQVSLSVPADWGDRQRVTVMTAANFGYANPDNDDFDVALFTTPKALLAQRSIDVLGRLRKELVYCIRPSHFTADAEQEFWLQSLAGQVIFRSSVPRSVNVMVLDGPTSECRQTLRGLARKRAAIWHNDQRNEFIAAVVRALTGKAVHTSVRLLDHLDRDTVTILKAYRPATVSILVEGSEHGQALLELLPGWNLRLKTADASSAIPCSHRTIYSETRGADEDLDTDVLIRANGGRGPLNVNAFPRRGGKSPQPLLIDLADDFDDAARTDTKLRLEQYRKRGWTVVASPAWAEE